MTRYIFVCACGCGQVSDDLKNNYVRLTGGSKWYAKGCVPENENLLAKRTFKNGFIVKEEDF